MLPHRTLLEGARHPEAFQTLLTLADTVLRTWEPHWSGFLSGGEQEEIEAGLTQLSELRLHWDGGVPGAERRCLRLSRAEQAEAGGDGSETGPGSPPLQGLEISGNFLFDPASAPDLRSVLETLGADPREIGDLWLRGDRGAQAVVSAALAERLDGRHSELRTVPVQILRRPITELQPPAARLPRPMATVEASLRLDAVASAGFGLPRSRVKALISQGAARINWQRVQQPSTTVAVGDRIRLDGRGELRILEIQTTKRDRWRLSMERR
ncbi:MAG: photosystem II S4 domain protein [Cyanobacteriota bacterium]